MSGHRPQRLAKVTGLLPASMDKRSARPNTVDGPRGLVRNRLPMSLRDEPAAFVRQLLGRRWRRWAVVGILCAVTAGLSVECMRRQSVTVDEPMNLVAGYTFWKFDDGRVEDSNGVMPQRWFTLPLLFMDVKFPSRDNAAWHQPGYLAEQICLEFLWSSGNDPDAMLFRGRLMALAFALGLVVAVYGWTARVFGRGAGLLATFFCALSPTILAHGHLMTLDVPAALFFLMSAGSCWLLLHRFTLPRLAASVGCFGLLTVTKISSPLFVPIALVMLAMRAALGRPWPGQIPGFGSCEIRTWRGYAGAALALAVAHALGAALIIWTCYGWRFHFPNWDPAADGYTESFAGVMSSLGSVRPVLAAVERWRLLPEGYIYGVARTLKHAEVRPAFLNGHYSSKGWWYYFPYCFLVKTTVPELAAGALGFGCAVAWALRRRAERWGHLAAWLDRTSLFWSLVVVYGLAAVSTPLNIGQRHLLPIYPAFFALAGAGLWWLMQRGRWGFAAGGVVLALQLATVARIRPYYLAYFNAVAGGPAGGYEHLTDSNVDWGQDLPALVDWLRQNPLPPGGGRVYVNLLCWDSPTRWGLTTSKLPYDVTNPRFSSDDPVAFEPGIYCLSATTLMLPGPAWTTEHERQYRRLLARMNELAESNPPNAYDPDNRRMWADLIYSVARSQYARLRGFLLHRKPDAMVGYSILIYRISDAELHRALLAEGGCTWLGLPAQGLTRTRAESPCHVAGLNSARREIICGGEQGICPRVR